MHASRQGQQQMSLMWLKCCTELRGSVQGIILCGSVITVQRPLFRLHLVVWAKYLTCDIWQQRCGALRQAIKKTKEKSIIKCLVEVKWAWINRVQSYNYTVQHGINPIEQSHCIYIIFRFFYSYMQLLCTTPGELTFLRSDVIRPEFTESRHKLEITVCLCSRILHLWVKIFLL